MQNHPVIKLIKQSNSLPKIPKAIGEILNMLLDPCDFNIDECINKLSDISDLEPMLIKVLNHNSKLNRKFLTLKDAVLYLGAKNTKMIIIAYITRLLLPNKNGRTKIFTNKIYWKHCIGTSIASYKIAAETRLCDKDKIFIYGLIHDIGITVLDICLPDHLDKIYTMQSSKGIHQIVAEKVVLGGITHEKIGMWLCKEWGLPEEILKIVGYHHSPLLNSQTSNEVMIMYLADSISANYYEKLLGNSRTFIYFDKIKELLNIQDDLLTEISTKLPEEIEKVNRIIDFNFSL